ncbi:MAG: peptidoglycan-binding LysM, partial [Okeania sp. SIO2D1]|nr:peptidoglycan-binding LysM [Okeania sp. SIO2D1]
MTLEKLTIIPENEQNNFDKKDKFEVLFNPNEITITMPGVEIGEDGLVVKEDLTTLSLDLFFDTTLQKYPPENVQKHTDKIISLTQPLIGEDKKRPPRCQLLWGTISDKDSVLLADCFLETVTKKLTHFLPEGTPVRATLNCTFKEWKEPKKQKKSENPIDDPDRIVKRG